MVISEFETFPLIHISAADLQVEFMQAHAHGRFFFDGARVAHVQVALLVLQLGDFPLHRAQVSAQALVFRLQTPGLLLLLHDLSDLGLQQRAAGPHFAGLTTGLLELFLHPRHCSDQILCQLRVFNQACAEGQTSQMNARQVNCRLQSVANEPLNRDGSVLGLCPVTWVYRVG